MKMSTKQNGTLDNGFTLSSDNAVLGLQLTGSQTLGEIVLTNKATTKTYTLHCDGVALTAEAILFYIVVPVKEWANGMRVEVYDNDGDIILMKEKAGEIMFSATDAMVMPTLQTRERGKRIGIFSVGEGKYVSFSQGNLQYIQSTKTWQFAKEQYAYMGEKHYRNGQLADTIEYFGWSGKNSKVPWGISLSTELPDYEGEFLDWGTNTIAGDAANTWRTLSNDEWLYICQERKNADQLLGLGTIGTVTGLIILPDDWQLPKDLSFTPNTDDAAKNQYTYEQWAKIESEGAVFIATCGYFNHKLGGMRHIGEEGHIRTNALSDRGLQIYTVVKTDKIIYSYSGTQEQNLQYAFAQRLVHDTIPPVLTFTVNGVSFDMIYVEGGTFKMGSNAPDAGDDEQPVHEVTLSNYYIGQTEVTQHLWKKVMGDDNPSVKEGNDLPVTNISWGDCQTFVEKLSEMTGMHFRLPTEAEWEYAARGGQKSKGYVYAGSDNIDEVAWYPDNCTQPQAVGMKQPNELGIYDMTGNVYEWCYDWYGPYSAEAQTNPQGPTSSSIGYRIVRGGCWQAQTHGKPDSHYCRIANRGHDIKGNERIGLRIVRKE
jgi:formylglycine-generating enzyme required for sulfatase activity